jgi:hypothetical protein
MLCSIPTGAPGRRIILSGVIRQPSDLSWPSLSERAARWP